MKDYTTDPPPNCPKPEYKTTPSLEAQSCELLILILVELQKINKHLDKLLIDGEVINVKEIHKYD